MVTVNALIASEFDTVMTSVPLFSEEVYAPVALIPFDAGIVVVVVVVVEVRGIVVEVGAEVVVDDDVPPALAHAFGVPYWTASRRSALRSLRFLNRALSRNMGLSGRIAGRGS